MLLFLFEGDLFVLFVLRLNVRVNNFSVIPGPVQRSSSYFESLGKAVLFYHGTSLAFHITINIHVTL